MNVKNNNDDNWFRINEFLERERDSIFATLTHIRLIIAGGIIAVILLSSSSFLFPIGAYLEGRESPYLEGREGQLITVVLVASFGITAMLVLVFVLAALYRLYKAVERSLEKDLMNRVEAIEFASSKAGLELPPKTKKLLKTFYYRERDFKPSKENESI